MSRLRRKERSIESTSTTKKSNPVTLDDIIVKMDQLVMEYDSYSRYLGSGDQAEIDILLNMEDKFTKLYNDLRDIASTVYGHRTVHDDKACTAYKARIIKKLFDADKKLSWNKAVDLAAASPEYEQFLNERSFYYESWDSVNHLRETLNQYNFNIGKRLKFLERIRFAE